MFYFGFFNSSLRIKDFDEISDSLEKMKNQKILQMDVTIFKEKMKGIISFLWFIR